ncbi:UV radiation resistance protein and autophagy-related subunit 14-domain-containing protein [Geopyxis carbonaria]|nr:UV radiation resistance protein and autophagy-related subunit 14-domain-containing protein [Geopyxis carbonaria]
MPSASDGEAPATSIPLPVLLPQNRRLRHLSGLSLRNLGAPATPPGASPAPSKLPTTPATAAGEVDDDVPPIPTLDNSQMKKPEQRRRRSTKVLLQRWESASQTLRGDAFFSLHRMPTVEGEEGKPLYISEVVPKSMNPDFQSFDLSSAGPAVTRSDCVVVKVWVDYGAAEGWSLLVESEVKLGELGYLGKNIADWRFPLPRNAIVFHLADGCYADVPVLRKVPTLPAADRIPSTTTSSYDTLLRLTNLETCIYDANFTTARISAQISSILTASAEPLALISSISTTRVRLEAIKKSLAIERRRLATAQRRRTELKESHAARRAAMADGAASQDSGEAYLTSARTTLDRSKASLASTREATAAQRQRIVAELMSIYPIVSLPGAAHGLAFTIRGLHLPSSNHEDAGNPHETSAALGHVSHILTLLSYYLGTPLRYPLRTIGSTSWVLDPISVIQGPRAFPLYVRGAVYYRFEYALFLVNKDLEQLMKRVGLQAVDIRHTLGNLKSLGLFVAGGGGGWVGSDAAAGGGSAPGSARPSLSLRLLEVGKPEGAAGIGLSRSPSPVPPTPTLRNIIAAENGGGKEGKGKEVAFREVDYDSTDGKTTKTTTTAVVG